MHKLYYDFHIHSCLSPCGNDDMTPANIVGMAMLKGLDVIALTDHNSCLNCEALCDIAKDSNLTVLCGMELTTQEEVHVLCLFSDLEHAMIWNDYVYQHLIKVENNIPIFGHQWKMDRNETILYEEPNLLINATTIAFHQVYELVTQRQGIIIPAHINKTSNSIFSNLGFLPANPMFTCAEVNDGALECFLERDRKYLEHCNLISDSDAHDLGSISEPTHYIYADGKEPEDILYALNNVRKKPI